MNGTGAIMSPVAAWPEWEKTSSEECGLLSVEESVSFRKKPLIYLVFSLGM